MADKSKAETKGIAINLDKTFKDGLTIGKKSYLKDWNIGFDSFFGETKESGKYNANAPNTKEGSVSIGATTKGGTTFGLTHSQTKAEENEFYPERKTKSTILTIKKSFNKGGKVKKAYLGSLLQEVQALTRLIESTIREWYNAF